ncbi:hypothetical protein DZF91_09825 [Actinomadura logoneensis]|uniref:DUF1877 family protein n=1 Tax=Actinomadura logoneensis TaxID=2293572 RepID=A0A372JP80_9ACTN|nr:hypothetical protein [Actinomadura logoneensis]RFU41822.1 hypothetical protein DZF91_09825 [Actinomadura logoneensis]
MGLDLTALIIDWTRLLAVAPESRYGFLENAVAALLPEGAVYDPPPGLVWPERPEVGWYALYEFRDTSGSYKPHAWAGRSWEHMRDAVGPSLRADGDAFFGRLLAGDTGDHLEPGIFPGQDVRHVTTLVACAPDTVRALADVWTRLAPRLPELRTPFDAHAAEPGRWIGTFDEFTALTLQWADAVQEAASRKWALAAINF